jgi:hypothetical protein
MRTTLDIPDELYRQVKARAALLGRTVREVTTELYGQWLAGQAAPKRQPVDWLADWVRLGDEALGGSAPAPTAREILEADRRRLEDT